MLGVRRIYRPAIALALLACSVTAWAVQPFYDQSNPDLSAMTLNTLATADGLTCSGRTADIRPNLALGTVQGTATYQFQNTSGQERTVSFGIAPAIPSLQPRQMAATFPRS